MGKPILISKLQDRCYGITVYPCRALQLYVIVLIGGFFKPGCVMLIGGFLKPGCVCNVCLCLFGTP